MVLDGIYVDGEKAKFNPEDILSGSIPDYSDKVVEAVEAWLEENISGGETIAVDNTLTVAGAAADAKATGDKITNVKDGALRSIRDQYSDIYPATVSMFTGGISTVGRNLANVARARTNYIQIEGGKTYLVHLDTDEYTFIGMWLYSTNSQDYAVRNVSSFGLDGQNVIFTAAETGETHLRSAFFRTADPTSEITETDRNGIIGIFHLYVMPDEHISERLDDQSLTLDGILDYPPLTWDQMSQITAQDYVLSWRTGYWTNSNTASNSASEGCIRYWTWLGKARPYLATNYIEFTPPTEGYIVLKEFESKSSSELLGRYEFHEKTTFRLHDTHIYRIYVAGLSGAPATYLDPEFINSIRLRPIYSVTKSGKDPRTGEFIRFNVKVNNRWAWPSEIGTDTGDYDTGEEHDHMCILTLPESYSPSGDKTPLIMYCHGASCGITSEYWYGNSTGEGEGENFLSMVRTFTAAGYAIFDVNNTRGRSGGFPDWGSLPLMSAYVKAWEYIKAHYNVEDKLYLLSASMGTPANLNFMKWYKGSVIASLILAPRPLSIKKRWVIDNPDPDKNTTYATAKMYLVAWGYAPDSILTDDTYVLPSKDSVFTSLVDDKRRGFYHYENMVTIDGTNYIFEKFPPMKVFVGTSDTGFLAEVREYFEAVRNFGNYVEYRELLGQSHGATCTLVNGSTRAEAISWFNRFRNSELSTD